LKPGTSKPLYFPRTFFSDTGIRAFYFVTGAEFRIKPFIGSVNTLNCKGSGIENCIACLPQKGHVTNKQCTLCMYKRNLKSVKAKLCLPKPPPCKTYYERLECYKEFNPTGKFQVKVLFQEFGLGLKEAPFF
jgi:hypothetical protein